MGPQSGQRVRAARKAQGRRGDALDDALPGLRLDRPGQVGRSCERVGEGRVVSLARARQRGRLARSGRTVERRVVEHEHAAVRRSWQRATRRGSGQHDGPWRQSVQATRLTVDVCGREGASLEGGRQRAVRQRVERARARDGRATHPTRCTRSPRRRPPGSSRASSRGTLRMPVCVAETQAPRRRTRAGERPLLGCLRGGEAGLDDDAGRRPARQPAAPQGELTPRWPQVSGSGRDGESSFSVAGESEREEAGMVLSGRWRGGGAAARVG